MSEQLAHYISEQINAGVSTDKIKSALRESGWKDEAVLEALSELKEAPQQKNTNSRTAITIGIGLLLVACIGVAVYAAASLLESNEVSVQLEPPPVVPVVETQPIGSIDDMYGSMDAPISLDETQNSTESLAMGTDYAKLASTLAEKLPACEKSSLSYIHFFDGLTYTKAIEGMTDRGCHYSETLPNNGVAVCYFSEQQLDELTQYLAENTDTYAQQSETGNFAVGYSSQSQDSQTDPWQKVFNDPQTCVLTGY